jgi:hypothetical protein
MYRSDCVGHRADAFSAADRLLAVETCRKEAGFPMANPLTPDMPPCAICGKPCDLTTCKVTHDGKAVHEECAVAKLAVENLKGSNDAP